MTSGDFPQVTLRARPWGWHLKRYKMNLDVIQDIKIFFVKSFFLLKKEEGGGGPGVTDQLQIKETGNSNIARKKQL